MSKYLLIGNPNVGKTTFYNNHTDQNERISNFEGVTLTKKVGIVPETSALLIDLPGINNLNANGIMEKSITSLIIAGDYDGVVYIADINNLKRNFYLLLDVLELGVPVKLILTMSDLYNGTTDLNVLEKELNISVETVHFDQKIDFSKLEDVDKIPKSIKYPEVIETAINKIMVSQKDNKNLNDKLPLRFYALQAILKNEEVLNLLENQEEIELIINKLEQDIKAQNLARSISGYIFGQKREKIIDFVSKSFNQHEYNPTLPLLNKYGDKIFLHHIWGYVFFIFIMWLVFLTSFEFAFLGDILGNILTIFGDFITQLMVTVKTPEIIISFFNEAVVAGIGAVIVFIPQIIILFALLTLLEGVGYFSRVSVLFENLFNKIGLSAHSLIPLISGLGCNVLSIMATRTIKSEPKRIATIFAAPYISCTARFPVYLIFIELFFPKYKSLVLLSIYLLGIIVAILVAYIIDKLIYRDFQELGIISLPKYKSISLKYFKRAVIAKVKSFLNKAGRLIFIGTLCIWVLMHFNFTGYVTDPSVSFIHTIANQLAVVLQPLGFGTPEAASSLISAFFAKELAIASMQLQYGTSSITELSGVLSTQFSMASAYSFMIFTLLYVPCISTLGVIYSETKKKSFVIYSLILSLVLGYLFAFFAFQILNLL